MAVTDVIDSIAICRLPMMSASVQRIHRRRFQTSPVTESVRFIASKTHNHGQHTITITSNERKERKKEIRERETFEKGDPDRNRVTPLLCPVHRAAHSNTSRSLCRHCTIPLPRCIQPTANSRGRRNSSRQLKGAVAAESIDGPMVETPVCRTGRIPTKNVYRHGKRPKRKIRERERELVRWRCAFWLTLTRTPTEG
jgi:hypothetical protein